MVRQQHAVGALMKKVSYLELVGGEPDSSFGDVDFVIVNCENGSARSPKIGYYSPNA